MKRTLIAIATAALVSAAISPAAVAASSKPRTKPATSQKVPANRPAPVAQDQSYLFLSGPKEGRGVPDYITAGMKHSNQPWFMTRYDRLGNWP